MLDRAKRNQSQRPSPPPTQCITMMSSSTTQQPWEDEEEDKEEEDGGSSSKPRSKRNPPRSRRVNDVDYTEQHHDEDEEDSDGSIKPRAKKKPRKKANAAVGGGGDDDRPASILSSIDLLNSKTTPKIVAEALLALLPKAATKHDAAAKTLMKAFPIITAELEARTSALTRKTESEGTRLPIAFYFPLAGTANDGEEGEGGTSSVVVHIPEECFIKMFTFLNGKEVVNVSTVNKVWLSISRKPEVWNRLDSKNGLAWYGKHKRLNMTSLLALLSRPQFANLKYLQLPNKCKVGKKSLRSISKSCPNLETFDMGGSRGSDSDLLTASEIFSNLTGLHFSMGDISNNGIMSAVRMMGESPYRSCPISNLIILPHLLNLFYFRNAITRSSSQKKYLLEQVSLGRVGGCHCRILSKPQVLRLFYWTIRA